MLQHTNTDVYSPFRSLSGKKYRSTTCTTGASEPAEPLFSVSLRASTFGLLSQRRRTTGGPLGDFLVVVFVHSGYRVHPRPSTPTYISLLQYFSQSKASSDLYAAREWKTGGAARLSRSGPNMKVNDDGVRLFRLVVRFDVKPSQP